MQDPHSTATHFRVIGEGVNEFRDFAEELRISIYGPNPYVLDGGVNCPRCGSLDIAGGFVEVEAGSAYQKVVCMACGKSWKDIYKLVAYEEEEDA